MRSVLFTLVLVLATAVGGGAALAQPRLQTPAPTGRIVVKLAPASGLTMSDAGLAGQADASVRLARLVADLAGGARLERRISLTARATAALTAAAAQRGRMAPDLNLYAHFDAGTRDAHDLAAIIARLAADPAVATAFAEPVAVPASLGFDAFTGASPAGVADKNADPGLPITPDFTSQQGYLEAAPGGVGAWAVAAIAGARGGTMHVVDVEGAWLWTHEDLTAPFFTAGSPIDDLGWRNHGTAVMGEMRGADNGLGVRGIVPDCAVGGSSIGSQSVAGAIASAAAALATGDLILIELHAPGPNANGSGQYGYVPMEFWQDNFDAIQLATALGVIVCEAAGNGEQNLDDAVYQGLFDRDLRDSGAIMIGATDGGSLNPAWFTNHGARVDCNGWGYSVTTTGYGNLQGGDETQWYTAWFSGTSSASPIVTGATASLQGMAKADFGFPLDAYLARQILSTTGTPVNGPQLIGTRPDLVAAWNLAAQGIGRVTGTVTEAGSGTPLAGILVTVAPTGARALTAAGGTYELPLLAGDYTLTFTDFFHATATAAVHVTTGTVVADASLNLLPLVTVSGHVVAEGGTGQPGAVVTPLDVPVAPAIAGTGGAFTLGGIPVGTDLALIAGGVPGLGGQAAQVTLPATPGTISLTLTLPAADYNFETGAQGFTSTDLWQRGQPVAGPSSAFDGTWCWGIGMDGFNYLDDASGALVSPAYSAVEFALNNNLFLSFHYWLATEANFDGVHVEIDGVGVIEPVGGYSDVSLSGLGYTPGWSGHSDGWRTAVFDVSAMIGQAWQFRLVFGSDGGVTDLGVFVDGITLAERAPVSTPVSDDLALPSFTHASLAAYPNPFNPQTTLSWRLPAPAHADLEIYDPRGRLVATVLAGADVPATGSVAWDGRHLASGVYLARLRTTDGLTATQRVVLAK